ncbi:MAG: glycosyltransferase, partial [Candidatus Electrothrix sp. AR1]|nr:glycosyltransferase [Candidatus Electrothrix sp. AR1]
FGIPEHKLKLAPTGIDPSYLQVNRQSSESWKSKNGLKDCFLILYTGSFNEAYNFDSIFKVANELSKGTCKIKWLFAGNGRQLNKILQAQQENSDIFYMGNLAKDDLTPLYANADLGLLLHSDVELLKTALSGKLFDYFSHKITVLSLSKGISGKIVKLSGGGVVIDQRDVSAITDIILKLVGNRSELAKMSERGFAWASKHFQMTFSCSIINDLLSLNISNRKSHQWIRFVPALIYASRDFIFQKNKSRIQTLFTRNIEMVIDKSLEEWLSLKKSQDNNLDDYELPEIISKRKIEL